MANTAASKEFGVGKIAENLSTAMYLFGVGAGSLFIGPLSETVGRNPTYLVSTLIYMLFVLGSALTPSFGGQIICRFFVGLFSSATLAVNGSSVRDQFRPVKRAFVFPVIAWANVAGKGHSVPSLFSSLTFVRGYSASHSTYTSWLDSIEYSSRLALDGMDDIGHFWGCIHYSALLLARDISSNPPRLESKASPSCDRRFAIYFRAL
jgi:MFS family permease